MEIVMTAQGTNATQIRRTLTTVVVLAPGEVFRLPEDSDRFFAVSGVVWLTDGSGDRIVWPGESAELRTGRGRNAIPAIVSGLGDKPVTLEFEGIDTKWWKATKQSADGTSLPKMWNGFWTLWHGRSAVRPKRDIPHSA